MTDRLDLNHDGQVLAFPVPVWRFRYLLNGGTVVDVLAHKDTSEVRNWLLQQTGATRIEGCAVVERLPDIVPEVES